MLCWAQGETIPFCYAVSHLSRRVMEKMISWHPQAKPPYRASDENGENSLVSIFMGGGDGGVSSEPCSEHWLQ